MWKTVRRHRPLSQQRELLGSMEYLSGTRPEVGGLLNNLKTLYIRHFWSLTKPLSLLPVLDKMKIYT